MDTVDVIDKKLGTTQITKKKRTLKYSIKRYGVLTLMASPALLYIFINSYLPMGGLFIAFKKIDYVKGIFRSPWVGLDNFRFLFATPDAFEITRNTILYNLVFIFLGLFLAVSVAIMLNEITRPRIIKFYQSAIIIQHMVSYTVVGYIVYAFLSPDSGFINSVITKVFHGTAVDWYADASKWPVLLIIINSWKHVGYNSVIYLAAIVGIDKSYYEAAEIDGASRFDQVRYVTLPMITPVIITLTILHIGRIFYSDFGLFYQVTLNSGLLFPTTNVIDTYVYRALMTTGNIGMSSAAGFYQSIVGFVMVLLANLAIRKVSKEDALF